MSGEITKELDSAIQHISRALGKLLNAKDVRSPNGRLRAGITGDQRKMASLMLKAISLRQEMKRRDE